MRRKKNMKAYGILGRDKTISCASSGTEGIARDLPSIELLSSTSRWQICHKYYHKLSIRTCDEGISYPTPYNGQAVLAVRPPPLDDASLSFGHCELCCDQTHLRV